MIVTLLAVPAVTGFGKPETVRVVAPAACTVMPLWVPVMEPVAVSVAVMDWLPAVSSVTERAWVPALAAVKV